jgi:hypothetical protein
MTQTTIQIKEPKAPATDAQIKFLTGLIAERECPTVAERYEFAKGFLTKGAASALINEAKAAPKKPYKTTQPKSLADWAVEKQIEAKQAQAAAEQIAATLTEIPAYGYYEIDGTFYYWDVTGKDVKPTLRRLQIVTNYNGTKKGSWKKIFGGATAWKDGVSTQAQTVTATYTPYAGKGWNKTPVTTKVAVPGVLVAAILGSKAAPLTQAQAAAKGKAIGFCIRCGATLTDPVSVANGIGPVCATYWA